MAQDVTQLLDKDTLISVRNRDNGTVGYSVPDLRVHRSFTKGEKKMIPMDELRRLIYTPGGLKIVKHYLVIENEDAARELLGNVEPEYFYSRKDIANLLQYGSYESLVDCLNFAPVGVIDLVKDIAVKVQLNDVRKRQLILEKTGFNVDKAIEINKETEEERPAQEKKVRLSDEHKTVVKTVAEPAVRMTAPPQYKVVSTEPDDE